MTAATFTFGGTFAANVPTTTYTKAGEPFRVRFDLPRTGRQFGNFLTAQYTLGKVTRPVTGSFASNLVRDQQSFTFGVSDGLFGPARASIVFDAARFFGSDGRGNIRYQYGKIPLRDGKVITLSLAGAGIGRGDITAPSPLVITK